MQFNVTKETESLWQIDLGGFHEMSLAHMKVVDVTIEDILNYILEINCMEERTLKRSCCITKFLIHPYIQMEKLKSQHAHSYFFFNGEARYHLPFEKKNTREKKTQKLRT